MMIVKNICNFLGKLPEQLPWYLLSVSLKLLLQIEQLLMRKPHNRAILLVGHIRKVYTADIVTLLVPRKLKITVSSTLNKVFHAICQERFNKQAEAGYRKF